MLHTLPIFDHRQTEKGFWSIWQLRLSVVLSLFLQLLLVWLGKRRQRLFTPWLNITIWSAYLAAGWFATVSLSTLLRSQESIPKDIIVFWTPFLILHLGGPDTITAYSLEDNETWLRHLLGLVVQVGTALYINYKFRTHSPLQFIAMFILITGIIKYGERIFILRLGSRKQFQKFLLEKKREDKGPTNDMLRDAEMSTNNEKLNEKLDDYLDRIEIVPETRKVYKAYISLKMFRPLLFDLSFNLYPSVMEIFTTRYESVEEAFFMVNTELTFLFDVLFTKTILFHKIPGILLRLVCWIFLVGAIFAFWFVLPTPHRFSTIDIFISYMLLAGAVILDTFGIVSNFCSPWMVRWLSKNKKWVKRLSYLRPLWTQHDEKGLIGQHNVIEYCVNASRMLTKMNIFDTSNILQKYWHSNWIEMNPQLRKMIYKHLLAKRRRYEEKNYKNLSTLLDERGGHAVQTRGDDLLKDFKWSLEDTKRFDHSVLIWHIATDLCYHDDAMRYGDSEIFGLKNDMSVSLSNYMVYLLVVRSPMLPDNISERRKKDTNEDITNLVHRCGDPEEARTTILFRIDTIKDGFFKENKSVMKDSFRLYRQLQAFVRGNRWDGEEKWEMISEVWLEMLTYAASRCSWQQHTQELTHGRELLTRVSLIMMHFGLNRDMVVDTETKCPNGNPPWDWENLKYLDYYLP